MKIPRLLKFALPFVLALVISIYTNQGSIADVSNYRLIDTIPLGGNPLTAFDISFVDSFTGSYYLSDGSNNRILVINTRTDQLIRGIEGFSGAQKGDRSIGGPNGLFVVNDSRQLFAGNGDSTIKVVDLISNRIVNSISTAGKKRADEGTYDSKDKIALIANSADNPPFVSLIDTTTNKVIKKIQIPGATDGLEASTWDSTNNKFYLAIPKLNGSQTDGGVARIDPKIGKVEQVFSLPDCSPAGIDIEPTHQKLLLGCHSKSLMINAANGKILASFPQLGGADEIWYNVGDKHFYLASGSSSTGPVLGIIDAVTAKLLQIIPTSPHSHSVAVDFVNNHIFVPLTPNNKVPNCLNGCIAVYAKQ